MPECVLLQYGYELAVPQSLMPFEGGVVVVLEYRWLHFGDHLVTSVTLVVHASMCAAG